MYVLLTDFRFVGPTDERYVTGGGGRPSVTLCDRGGSAERYVTPKIFKCIISYYNLYYCVCFINRFSICRADRRALRYGGGGSAECDTL